MNPVHTLTSYFLKIQFNIILLCTSRSGHLFAGFLTAGICEGDIEFLVP
jgi:hypothetical protein